MFETPSSGSTNQEPTTDQREDRPPPPNDLDDLIDEFFRDPPVPTGDDAPVVQEPSREERQRLLQEYFPLQFRAPRAVQQFQIGTPPESTGGSDAPELPHDDLGEEKETVTQPLPRTVRQRRVLDDVPEQFRKKRASPALSACPVLTEAFTVERSENQATSKSQELKLKEITTEQWPAMQNALAKEWGTWCKYDAVGIAPPEKAHEIDPAKILDSRAVWTNRAAGDLGFEPKCRIVGKGFQESYDDKLRRDSPTANTQMTNLL